MYSNNQDPDKEILYHYFNAIAPISYDELQDVFACVKKKSYEKGEVILRAGDVETRSSFVLSGVVHHFVYDDDLPVTTNLTPKGFAFNSLKSYMEGSPSFEIQEAVSDVELMYLQKEDIEKLALQSHAFSYLMFRLHEVILLEREDRMFLLQYRNPAKRFRLFHETVKRSNWLLDVAPDKYIASYLNMTPQQYSKEKKLFLKTAL